MAIPGNIPAAPFDELLAKILKVLELTLKPEGATTPQAKQLLLQATNDFKDAVMRSKEIANGLAGGELLDQDQDDILRMLDRLKQQKQRQLLQFTEASHSTSSIAESVEDGKMEVDSVASTPG